MTTVLASRAGPRVLQCCMATPAGPPSLENPREASVVGSRPRRRKTLTRQRAAATLHSQGGGHFHFATWTRSDDDSRPQCSAESARRGPPLRAPRSTFGPASTPGRAAWSRHRGVRGTPGPARPRSIRPSRGPESLIAAKSIWVLPVAFLRFAGFAFRLSPFACRKRGVVGDDGQADTDPGRRACRHASHLGHHRPPRPLRMRNRAGGAEGRTAKSDRGAAGGDPRGRQDAGRMQAGRATGRNARLADEGQEEDDYRAGAH